MSKTCLNCGKSTDPTWKASDSPLLKSLNIQGYFCSFLCLHDYEEAIKTKPKFEKGD